MATTVCTINGEKARRMMMCESEHSYSRDVFIHDSTGIIIKIGPQSERETYFLDTIESEDRKYFPIVFNTGKGESIDEDWIAEEYIDMLSRDEWGSLPIDKRTEIGEKLEEIIYKYGLQWDISKVSYRNWGIRRDTEELVIYDFAPLNCKG